MNMRVVSFALLAVAAGVAVAAVQPEEAAHRAGSGGSTDLTACEQALTHTEPGSCRPDRDRSGDATGLLRVAGAQIAPVWFDRAGTIRKVVAAIARAATEGDADVIAFGETLVPGYPFWLEFAGGARFDSAMNKALHSHYMDQAVALPTADPLSGEYPADECGDLLLVCRAAAAYGMSVYIGVAERDNGARSGHSLYASLVAISAAGRIVNVHRKLMPTYEERLTWAIGDGHGLRTQRLRVGGGAWTVGALNCYENWMPLSRAALYGQGESLHVAVWPGSDGLTRDITRFVAREGRVYVLSVSGVMRPSDIPDTTPYADALRAALTQEAAAAGVALKDHVMANGGTCVAGPDGAWVVSPDTTNRAQETIVYAELNPARVREERQTFDPAGHYSRPDVTQLTVNRRRQSTAVFIDD